MGFADYLDKHKLSKDCVKEIRLICEDDISEVSKKLLAIYPNAKITIINKSVWDLEFEDLYVQHSLVLNYLGDICLQDKAYQGKLRENGFEILPRREKIENLARLLRDTRFIYNIIAYNKDEDNILWQMEEFEKILSSDTRPYQSYAYDLTHVEANTWSGSLKWHDEPRTPYEMEMYFDERQCREILTQLLHFSLVFIANQ